MELKDEDTKKALECCSSDRLSKCVDCGISKNGCQEYLASQALDLINRLELENEVLKDEKNQLENDLCNERMNLNYMTELCGLADCENTRLQAEIERLKTDLKTTENVIKNSFLKKAGFDIDLLAEFKSEAIKEFAERFIDEECAYCSSGSDEMIFFKKRFDNFLAERVGGEDA